MQYSVLKCSTVECLRKRKYPRYTPGFGYLAPSFVKSPRLSSGYIRISDIWFRIFPRFSGENYGSKKLKHGFPVLPPKSRINPKDGPGNIPDICFCANTLMLREGKNGTLLRLFDLNVPGGSCICIYVKAIIIKWSQPVVILLSRFHLNYLDFT